MAENTVYMLKQEVEAELRNGIMPYWLKAVDERNGGFIGRVDGEGKRYPDADKGGVLNARILWTFSAAYRLTGEERYRRAARRAKEYFVRYFYDEVYGGIYWSVDCTGRPKDTKKQIYALGFGIYGLSEYYRATGDREALEYAKALFRSIERYSFDPVRNGYFEAFNRQWEELSDVRLSEKDDNDRKTMNTHLHILEPYTNLYRVWKDEELKKQLKNLTELFLDRILDSASGHLNLFFDENWECRHRVISYGHDIEASWLLYEAAAELEEAGLLERVKEAYVKIAEAAAQGLQTDGSMIYEWDKTGGWRDTDRHWWVQAETVVGYFNAYQHTGRRLFLVRAWACWGYIRENLIDRRQGEWLWSRRSDGSENRTDDKIGPWKCPYHNGRMCLELIERIGGEEE